MLLTVSKLTRVLSRVTECRSPRREQRLPLFWQLLIEIFCKLSMESPPTVAAVMVFLAGGFTVLHRLLGKQMGFPEGCTVV